MKFGILFTLSFLIFELSFASSKLCVQTFNAYGPAYAPSRDDRTRATVDEIAAQSTCDIHQYQEVWVENHFELFQSLYSKSLGAYEGIRFDQLRSDGKRSGLATFFSGELLESKSFLFKANEEGLLDWFRKQIGIKKGVGFLKLNLKTMPTETGFFTLHLHPTSSDIRIKQIFEIGDWMIQQGVARMPLVMTGDLNALPDSMEWQLIQNVLLFEDAYASVHRGYDKEVCTYCSKENPLSWGSENRVFDYVFYRGTSRHRLHPTEASVNLKKRGNRFLSDHYGVRAKFDVQTGTEMERLLIGEGAGHRVNRAIEVLTQVIQRYSEKEEKDLHQAIRDFASSLKSKLENLRPGDPEAEYFGL